MNKELSACFSGHRKEDFDLHNSLKGKIFYDYTYTTIIDAIESGIIYFYCGMAQGFDIFAAEVFFDVKAKRKYEDVKLISIIPYKDHHKNWTVFWKKKFSDVVKNSDKTILLSENYYTGCFHTRNKYIVDNSNLLICNYNGKKGGTSFTVKYAEENFLKIININKIFDKNRLYQASLF